MLVWLNGQFVERESASVSVFDAGFQHGVGLFETMSARHGTVFRAADHIKRLADSATSLMLTERLHVYPLVDAVNLAVQKNELEQSRVRLTLTGGNLDALQREGHGPADPTILIVAQPPTVYPEEFFDKGVTALIADGRVNPLDPMAGHKTLNYWPRIRALQLASSKRASEALWFSVSNHLASGSVSNVFLVKEDGLLTPIARGEEVPGAMAAPVLPGITRRAVMEIASNAEMSVQTKMLDINDLLGADEVFLTNSSWGVLPVVRVEAHEIGPAEVGPRTRLFRDSWRALVDSETAEMAAPERRNGHDPPDSA